MKNISIEIKNKKILLFGACGVLGRQHAKILSNSSCELVIADHPKTDVLKLAKKIGVKGFKIDVLKEKSLIKGIKEISKYLNGIDAAIYNAAITSEQLKKNNSFYNFENYPLALWKKTIDVNLTGSFLFAREIGKIFIHQNFGNLINISSIYGVVAPDHSIYDNETFDTFPGYSASKFGMIGLSKWLATRWAKNNIRVNSVSPGGIFNNQSKSFIKKYSKRVPLSRMGHKDEITGILLYLISDHSSYCTGQNFIIDGGLSSW
mgnify:CR=1 FL=1|jgi:NAD(P)-dependent dehydrogenase (short-subunit alcohol dehydrogenase family)|tara:strand:+ start:1447 stop:2232 length:786 start_codon:yes stop_codon:yes gene_type:complete